MPYVDGFVLPVPRRKIAVYLAMARKSAKIFKEYGALEFRECAGDDLRIKGMLSFVKMAKAKPGETVFFSFIVYKSRADRDRVNAKIMKDPRFLKMMQGKSMPFDLSRMAYGGFKVLVNA